MFYYHSLSILGRTSEGRSELWQIFTISQVARIFPIVNTLADRKDCDPAPSIIKFTIVPSDVRLLGNPTQQAAG
jgi:hypothetical protein